MTVNNLMDTADVDLLKEKRGRLEWHPKARRPAKTGTKSANDRIRQDIEKLLGDLKTEALVEKEREEKVLQEIGSELNSVGFTEKECVRMLEQTAARISTKCDAIEVTARELATNFTSVTALAGNISARVANLDVAKSRVVACLDRVTDLRDLKTCTEEVQPAIDVEDYERAAQFIHRFYTLKEAVFRHAHTPTSRYAHNLAESYGILESAASRLKAIIEREFDAAVSRGDTASMERFFKLFPLINDHQTGLEKFGKHLCDKITRACADFLKIMQAGGTDDKRRNVLYSDTMTMILEEIARDVLEYQPLIDSFYGADKLLNLMEIIQVECDNQTTKVLDAFVVARQWDQRFRAVREYLRGSASSTAEKIDPIALDVLLSEVTLIHTRAELYWRFLKRRLGEAPARALSEDGAHQSPRSTIDDDDEDEITEEERQEIVERQKKAKVDRTQKLDSVLNRSKLGTRMQEILGQYVMMEQYYMQESVTKALESEDADEGSLTTSVLDDVFFIVRKCIRRSITSSSVDCVCAMINNGMALLETDYHDRLTTAIRAGYPSTGWTAEAYQHAQTAYNVLQHGKSVAEAGPETQKRVFLAAFNNVRASAQCIATLKAGLVGDFEVHLKQITSTDKSKLENSVDQLDELARKFEETATLGAAKLATAAFRPRLKATAEQYLDYSHDLSDDQFNEFEAVDPFVEGFIAELDNQIHNFEGLLVPENYDELVNVVAAEAAYQLERVVLKCAFNHLGGIQLDKEYRQFASYLTTIAGWKVREKCAKLSQVVSLLASDSIDDAVSFFTQLQSSPTGAVLSVNDLKKVLGLRIDFSKDKVKAIKV